MIDYKEYTKQMRENSIVVNGIIQVTEELWLQIADIIDDLAEKQTPKKLTADKIDERQYCPTCGNVMAFTKLFADYYRDNYFYPYCPKCGQALDWGQEE